MMKTALDELLVLPPLVKETEDEVKYEELFITCVKCDGSGNFTERKSHGMGLASTSCGPCPDCNGRGGEVTDSGKAILAFLRKARERGLC